MTIKINAKSRVHRILRKLDRFSKADVSEAYSLRLGEILGEYDNSGSRCSQDKIIVCDHGIVLNASDGDATEFCYSDISTVNGPSGGTVDPVVLKKLFLVFHDSAKDPYELNIEGRTENAYDSFEFWRFFLRVIEDSSTQEE